MKKLIALVLSLVALFTFSVAMAGDEPTDVGELENVDSNIGDRAIIDIEWIVDQISPRVGYRPYVLETDLGEGVTEWLFVMCDTSIVSYVTGEESDDFEKFLDFVETRGFDWYAELPEYVTITEEEEIRVGKGLVYYDYFFKEPDNLVLGYEAYNLWLGSEEYTEENGVYTFSKKYLAQLVYENEMSHIQYVGDLLDEIR